MDTFTIITENLTRKYVLYIPPILISKLKSTVYEGIIPDQDTNTLVFLDDNRQGSTNINAFSMFELVGKKDILDNNLIQLFEAKKNLEEQHFRVLLDKYISQVEGHLFATKWMYKNINKVFMGLEQSFVNLFKLQAEYFESHNNELNRHFEIKSHKISDKNVQLLKHFEDTYSNPDFKVIVPNFKTNGFVNKKSKSVKKQKAKVSDEEIDRFLLTTVFNVEL